MSEISVHRGSRDTSINPGALDFEVLERKFRGHPDSLADLTAQTFSQKYIKRAWELFPELNNRYFPNFSADKVMLSGGSSRFVDGKCDFLKPVDALLVGKITSAIGDVTMGVMDIFRESVSEVLSDCLGHNRFEGHIRHKEYSVALAGLDHSSGFYHPQSTEDLMYILNTESVSNDTVFVVAYSPLTITERLSIYLDNSTASDEFQKKFPSIGSDVKAMIRRRGSEFVITLCLPVMPEIDSSDSGYVATVALASEYLRDKISHFLSYDGGYGSNALVSLHINTKDTPGKKYFAVWGTSLSKGDVGAVGRGNRQQGFISGMRPSTNEAMSGKNPNHFAGVIYQLVAEKISLDIYGLLGIRNAVYITANNGDVISAPNSIDVILEGGAVVKLDKIKEIVNASLDSIPVLRSGYIRQKPLERFMRPFGYDE